MCDFTSVNLGIAYTFAYICKCAHTHSPPTPVPHSASVVPSGSPEVLVNVCVSMRGPALWQCGGEKCLPVWYKHQSCSQCARMCSCACVCEGEWKRKRAYECDWLACRTRSLWQFSKLFHRAVQFLFKDKFPCHLCFVPLLTVEKKRRRRSRRRVWRVTSLTEARQGREVKAKAAAFNY